MKFSKSILSLLVGVWVVFLNVGCGGTPEPENVRPMIYEGMPKSELRKVLGEPREIDSSGSVFDVSQNSRIVLERWFYESRTVVIINDTVKSAHVEERRESSN